MSDRIRELQIIIESAKPFLRISEAELNQRQTPNQWSIGQCIDHLLISNATYLPVFEKIFNGKYKEGIWHKVSPFTKKIGRNMVQTLGPIVSKKFLSPKIFLPRTKKIETRVVTDFISQQERLITLFTELEKDHNKSQIISSPVSSLITITVSDAMDIIIGHDKRHLRQAAQILKDLND